jgi:hypothetical protein
MNERPEDRSVYRILSLDGGGIRGVFPAAFLARLQEHLEHPIASYFDLIAGTSTGGIIAIGLGLGVSAGDMFNLYEEWDRRFLISSMVLRGRGFAGDGAVRVTCSAPSIRPTIFARPWPASCRIAASATAAIDC